MHSVVTNIGKLRIIILVLKVLTEITSIMENGAILRSSVDFCFIIDVFHAEAEEFQELGLVACEIG